MTENPMVNRIRQEVKANHLVVFMKGTPAKPRCGFSKAAAEKLAKAGIAYKSIDVLSDPALFDGLRQYTNYTHFPQVFVDGRFVGSTENLKALV